MTYPIEHIDDKVNEFLIWIYVPLFSVVKWLEEVAEATERTLGVFPFDVHLKIHKM